MAQSSLRLRPGAGKSKTDRGKNVLIVQLSGHHRDGTHPETVPPATESVTVELHHEYAAQHTLSWRSTITWRGVTLEPGSCNLYCFPAFSSALLDREAAADSANAASTQTLEGERLELLMRLVLSAAASDDGKGTGSDGGMCSKADCTGACKFRALNLAALDLAARVRLVYPPTPLPPYPPSQTSSTHC